MKLHAAVAAFCVGLTLHAEEQPLRMSGSTTVKYALEAKQSVLETAVGRPIEIGGTGTAAGLLSLVTGTADVAMLSMPLEDVVRTINARTPGRVDTTGLNSIHIGDVKNIFIVNPRNPVRSLTAAQVEEIMVGTITNWKEVGGPDAPIIVLSLAQGGPLLEDQLLHGRHVTPNARTVPNATQIPVFVAQNPHAIGFISTLHARGQTSVVHTDATVVAHLYLVTKGESSPAVKKLVEAAKAMLGSSS